MSVNNRYGEPLFVIIQRDAQAHVNLKQWAESNGIKQYHLQDNRLHLFDHNNLSTFLVTWDRGWSNLVIWDAWNKRHLDIQND